MAVEILKPLPYRLIKIARRQNLRAIFVTKSGFTLDRALR